jgi:4-amino-4-deoxy-L-arabinose transferase-like glycosyltransferase
MPTIRLSLRARAALRLLFAIGCGAALVSLLLPANDVIGALQPLAPDGALDQKTVLLIQTARWAAPIAGAMGFVWLVVAGRVSGAMRRGAAALERSRWTLPIILVIATLVRAGWLLYFPTQPYADSVGYMAAAGHLVRGEGYIWDTQSMQPLVGWPVGYPALLALLFLITGENAQAALALNLILAVLTVFLTQRLGLLLFGKGVGLLAALILAVYPSYVVYTSLVSTEIFFVTLTTLAFVLTVHQARLGRGRAATVRSAVATGVVAGMGALVRATGLLLAPFWALLQWSGRRTLKQGFVWAIIMAIFCLLVVLPWTARNYLRLGALIPVSTNGGMNFWIGNNANAHGAYMFPQDPEINPLWPIALERDEVALDAEGYRLGRAWLSETIRTHPARVAVLYRAKLLYTVGGADFGLHWNGLSAQAGGQRGTGQGALVLVNGVYWLLSLFAFYGTVALTMAQRRGTFLQWSPLLFFVYWLALHMPFFGQDRFMLPALPGIVIFGALGIHALFAATTPSVVEGAALDSGTPAVQ